MIIRNLTADNIMVKSNGKDSYEVKICDFSLAVHVGSLKVLCDHPLFEWNDVPYLAPEALLGHPYSTAMDVWSVGVLLYAMICGRLPFDSPNDKDLVEMIKFANYEFTADNDVWSGGANDKIKCMIGLLLVANPSDRPASKDGKLPDIRYNSNCVDIYHGNFANGKRHGFGSMKIKIRNETYSGQWVEGRMEGEGTYKYYNGRVYTGLWKNNQRDGLGELKNEMGDTFTGMWSKDLRHGPGQMCYSNGLVCSGEWVKDVFK
eukprot:gene29852-36972_t